MASDQFLLLVLLLLEKADCNIKATAGNSDFWESYLFPSVPLLLCGWEPVTRFNGNLAGVSYNTAANPDFEVFAFGLVILAGLVQNVGHAVFPFYES